MNNGDIHNHNTIFTHKYSQSTSSKLPPHCNHLSLSPFTLERHPSAKNLFDNSDNSITFNKEQSKDTSEEGFLNLKIGIQIEEVEDKIYSYTDNFYIKNDNPICINEIKSDEEKSTVNNFYCFTKEQLLIDQKITKQIQNGLSFEEIEKNFFYLNKEH
ncbi:MAG: hypothetical protein MJ252_06155 [archaeon]|nr:hypothetical protein [archaeon]